MSPQLALASFTRLERMAAFHPTWSSARVVVNGSLGSWSCENVSAEGDWRRQAQLSMLSQLRAGIDVVCPVRRERSGGADAHADAHPSPLDRRDERLHAEDVHNSGEIVGEHVQGHLGGNLRQALHQKGRRTHPHLERRAGWSGRASAGSRSLPWRSRAIRAPLPPGCAERPCQAVGKGGFRKSLVAGE
jgi:hypothetical protein